MLQLDSELQHITKCIGSQTMNINAFVTAATSVQLHKEVGDVGKKILLWMG